MLVQFRLGAVARAVDLRDALVCMYRAVFPRERSLGRVHLDEQQQVW